MYLSLLSEKEKKLFLGYAHALSSVDGYFSDEEKKMIDSYCYEMQLEFCAEDANRPIDAIVDDMYTFCGVQARKIVVFEAIGLAMSDGNYDKKERNLICSTMKKFGIDENFEKDCVTFIGEYIKLQNKINNLVIG